jgi:hypothetical protein
MFHKIKTKFVEILPILFASAIVALPFVLIPSDFYFPGNDEATQIEAAIRMNNGQGYKTQGTWSGKIQEKSIAGHVLPENDLANPALVTLTAWPIGLSTIIYIFLKLGLPIYLATFITKLLGCNFAVLSWVFFGKKILVKNDLYIYIAFMFILVYLYSLISVSDVYLIGFFGLIINITYRFKLKDNFTTLKINHYYQLLGIVTSLAILFKYSAIPFVLVVVIWIFFIEFNSIINNNNKFPIISVAPKLVKFAIYPLITIICIFLYNKLTAENYNTYMANGPLSTAPNWNFNWIVGSYRALSFESLLIPKLLHRYYLNNFITYDLYLNIYLFLSFSITFYIGYVLYKKGGIYKFIVNFFILSYFSTFLFLLITTILFFEKLSTWTPVADGRYYIYLIPMLFIGLLCVIRFIILNLFEFHWYHIIDRVYLFLSIVIIGFLSINIIINSKNYIYKVNHESLLVYNNINKIIIANNIDNVILFTDSDLYRSFPWFGSREVYVGDFQIPPHSYFSKRTLIILTCQYKNIRPHLMDLNNCRDLKYDDNAIKYSFNQFNASDNSVIYWKIY